MTRKAIIGGAAGFFVCLLILFGVQHVCRLPAGAIEILPDQMVTCPSGDTFAFSKGWYIGGIRNPDFVPGIYSVRMNLKLTTQIESSQNHEDYILVFPSVDGNALRVFFNGQFIGSLGDFAHGNSNFWYAAKFFSVPASMVSSENTIIADINGVYEAGISHLPYLIQKSANPFSLSWLSFSTSGLVILLAGAILIIGFILIFIGFSMYPSYNSRLFLGLACFLTALFLTDFMNLEYLPVSLLIFKKMVVISRHLAAIAFCIGFLKLFERPLDLFARMFIALQIVCSAILLYPATMHLLKQFYTVTYLTILPLPLYLLYFLFTKCSRKKEYSILLAGVVFATLTALRDVAIPLVYPGAVYYSHYGFMILIFTAACFIALDEINYFSLFVREKTSAERYRNVSLHDPLTGAWNRSMMEDTVHSLPDDFSLILMDIDDLKEINDRYGHLAGDNALRDLVFRAQGLIKHNDLVIRLGGDEFLIILPHCPADRLASTARDIADECSRSALSLQNGEVFGYSVSIGSFCAAPALSSPAVSFEEAMTKADEAMYANKQQKKRNHLEL